MTRFFMEPKRERGLMSASDTGDAGRLRFREGEEWCRRIVREDESSKGVDISSVRVMVP